MCYGCRNVPHTHLAHCQIFSTRAGKALPPVLFLFPKYGGQRPPAAGLLPDEYHGKKLDFPCSSQHGNFLVFLYCMRIIAKSTLVAFWEKTEYQDAEQQLKVWYKVIAGQDWKDPHEIIRYFQDADQVGNGRIVFNICRNKYRLIVRFRYDIQIGFIRFVGTHKQYDQIKDIKNI